MSLDVSGFDKMVTGLGEQWNSYGKLPITVLELNRFALTRPHKIVFLN